MGVTHDDKLLNEKPTIQELYLDPLRSIIENNGGTVFKDHDIQLVLMMDLKSDKEQTNIALKDVFVDYLDIIEWYKSDEKIHEPIQMLLTGGPPTISFKTKKIDIFMSMVLLSNGQWIIQLA